MIILFKMKCFLFQSKKGYMFMRKFLFVFICIGMLIITGCSADNNLINENKLSSNSSENNTGDIRIGCMKGPTAIGMIKLLSDSEQDNSINNYIYTIAGTADELTVGLINESLDIAAVPCNLASILYNKTNGEIVTVAVNTLGVLYIVEASDSIKNIEDLKGKTIYSTGQGTTPEYTLRYLLSSSGIDPDKDVTIEYKSEATEVVAAITQNQEAVAMLPQPYVTAAMIKNPQFHIALDITKEWEEKNDSTIVTGVIVARKSFIEDSPQIFENFLMEYKSSTEYANEYIEETSALLEQFDIFKANIAKQAIPYCNVVYEDGEDMQNHVLSYLKVLYEQNPAAIGGKMPEKGMFYFAGKEE